MALISCPECKEKVSEKALHCPHCGHPIITCPECKGQVPDKASHCPHCGCPIAAATGGGSRLSAFARVVAIYCVFVSPVMFGIGLISEIVETVEEQSKKSQPNYTPKYTVPKGVGDPHPLRAVLDWGLVLKSLAATVLLLWGGVYLLRIDTLGVDDRKSMANKLRMGFLVAIGGCIVWFVLFGLFTFSILSDGIKIRDDPVDFGFLAILGIVEAIFVVAAGIWVWLPNTYRQLQS